MNSRFKYLLERYVNRLATAEEEEELKGLVRSNIFEDSVWDDIDSYLSREFSGGIPDADLPVDADHLFQKILSGVQERPKPRRMLSLWSGIAAAIVVAMGLFWVWTLQRPDDVLPALEELAADLPRTYKNKDFIHLPDGSTVLLNEGSELTLMDGFGQGLREVTLSGEAFFEIKSDSARPFVVHTGAIKTKVLGTSFNINTRDEQFVVTVTKGLVQVGDEQGVLGLVKPQEQLVVAKAREKVEKSEVLPESAGLKWKDSALIFDGVSMDEAVVQLEKRFQVPIVIENESIRKCRIDAWFLHDEKLDEILEMIFGTRQATFRKEQGRVMISGGIACETDN